MGNRVELIGNVANDIKYHPIRNNEEMACFSVATNENYKNSNGERESIADYHDIVIFNKYLVKLSKNISKGDRVFIVGKLKHNSFIDKNGDRAYRTNVVIDNAGQLNVIKKFSQEDY